MPDSTNYVTVHDTACTNTNPDSCVVVQIAANVLAWEIPDNKYGDKLPMIPSSAHVQHGKILYHLPIKATVESRGGVALSGRSFTVKSNRTSDTVRLSGPTDSNGCAMVILESREPGILSLTVADADITAIALSVTLKDAWYESTFLITGYHVCFESDFSGESVLAHGTNDYHKRDFLYGARGVVMQGTGKASNGRYIRPTQVHSGWHRNSHGNRDYLDNPDGVAFMYTDSVQGAYGPVRENHSIAIDPRIIPKRAQVDIEMVGLRFGDDTGSAIIGHHIDNFVGAGAAVQATWENGSVNNTQRKVKYIGI
ncbi:3D domain-containing protein [Paraburkholderia caballeronis]|uniref:3D domain-containing protein n=1 Tax=Paraburkholderia caballeronis TaxID=416943 RepID=A0A1H7VRI3_9BURK|nr:3D domain-containing protein [Paraburkholderia caballeronis]PXW15501.1 3D domain-containing protein [Paraburkholderia caballeronis]PXW93786.1 3D domain-containing protein [Paraburkholderia caballeronis]RAJ89026.1 3D domain-containing protein [Paraburkholderia caballeronis]SEE00000.1 3D domain-containing protein [Paraburkholderia caballeronis]SEM11770.1 3D domain-containing protein [Paraburkholderia caballeronis]